MRDIHFGKFHGLSNDFIVSTGPDVGITRRGVNPSSTGRLQTLARSICNRHTGVGADGFVLVLAPQKKDNHARIRFFNADGSEAEMSGNGVRCAAAYFLTRAGHPLAFAPLDSVIERARELGTLRLETAAGVRLVRLVNAKSGFWVFRVSMGKPVFDPPKIPFSASKVSTPVVGFLLPTSHGTFPVTVTSMGNPHCSTFVADFDSIDWRAVGNEIENSGLFPERANVEFIQVHSRDEIEVRFWERGVGQTASSGTGSCGAVVACVLNGFTDRKVCVRTQAGILEVNWPRNGEVTLTGSVELISQGVYFYPGQG